MMPPVAPSVFAASETGLPRILMDSFDIVSKTVAILAGIIMASKAIVEVRNSRSQREQELRWKQAGMAREFLKDIHAHTYAMAAIEMLDWGDGRHEYRPKATCEIRIGEGDVVRSLAKPRNQAVEPVDEFIWESFDWLFYFMDRLEHHIQSGFLKFEDVRDVFRPYAAKMNADRARYALLIRAQDYRNVGGFLQRFLGETEQGGGP